MLKENKGITLVALVITIIVLLILAGVSIAMVTGEEGILTKASQAEKSQNEAALRDALGLSYAELYVDVKDENNTTVTAVTVELLETRAKKYLDENKLTRDGNKFTYGTDADDKAEITVSISNNKMTFES